MVALPHRAAKAHPPTRNQRFKETRAQRVWLCLTAATALHFLAFAAWPTMSVAVVERNPETLHVVPMEELQLPEAPEELAQPARPVIATTDVSDDLTIDPQDWDSFVPEIAPPAVESDDAERRTDLSPYYTRAPRLTNQDEVRRTLEREYPPTLRDAGIGGTVLLHVDIDAEGALLDVRVASSSGYDALDAAALRVARVFRFSPAYNMDLAVAVRVALPVAFESNDD